MRRPILILLSALVLAAPGCISSENGLSSPDEKEAVFNPELLGRWDTIDPKPEAHEPECHYLVERDDPKSKVYRISLITLPPNSKKAVPQLVIKALLVKLGDTLFLDILSASEPGKKEERGHYFWKLEIKKEELVSCPLDQEFLTAHPDLLRQSVAGTGFFRTSKVVATTQELRDFGVKHANDDTVWKKPGWKLRPRP